MGVAGPNPGPSAQPRGIAAGEKRTCEYAYLYRLVELHQKKEAITAYLFVPLRNCLSVMYVKETAFQGNAFRLHTFGCGEASSVCWSRPFYLKLKLDLNQSGAQGGIA